MAFTSRDLTVSFRIRGQSSLVRLAVLRLGRGEGGDGADVDVDVEEELRCRKGERDESVRERPRCFEGGDVQFGRLFVDDGWTGVDVLWGVWMRGSGMFISV
jgi:hypothetical protein